MEVVLYDCLGLFLFVFVVKFVGVDVVVIVYVVDVGEDFVDVVLGGGYVVI